MLKHTLTHARRYTLITINKGGRVGREVVWSTPLGAKRRLNKARKTTKEAYMVNEEGLREVW